MSSVKPYPLYTDGVNLYTSFDGVTLLPVANAVQSPILTGLNNDFLIQEMVAAQTLLPALTKFRRIPLPIAIGTMNVAATGDAFVEGTGLTTTQNTAATRIGLSSFQTPKSGKWWVAFIATLKGGGAAAHDSEVGLLNAAGTHTWNIGRHNATSSTLYTLQLTGTSSVNQAGILTADNNQHQFRMFFDGTTAWSYIDGVLDAQTSSVSQMADEAMTPIMFSQATGEVSVEDLVIGYIG